MHGRGDGVDESLVRIGREICGDLRPGRNCSCHFDIQLDLAIGSVGSPVGEFAAPSTETAVTFGVEIPRLLKNESRSAAL